MTVVSELSVLIGSEAYVLLCFCYIICLAILQMMPREASAGQVRKCTVPSVYKD